MATNFRAIHGLSRSRSTTDVYNPSSRNVPEDRLTSSYSATWSSSKRCSVASTSGISLTQAKKCTYLADDIRQQYELGYEAAAPVGQQNSFVKKLVATLERRHKDLRTTQNPRKELLKLKQQTNKSTPKRIAEQRIVSRSPAGLNSLQESAERDKNTTRDAVPPLPAKGMSIKMTAQRALKRFTSLLGWKNQKKPPARGTRDYYADRESLSDELGTFRRETVPKLMQKSPIRKGTKELKLREVEKKQFSELISSPLMEDDEKQSSGTHATIRRSYSIRIGNRLDEPSVHYRIPRCHLKKENDFSPPSKEGIIRTSTIKEPQERKFRRMPPSVPPPLPPLPPRQHNSSTFQPTIKQVSQDPEFASVQLRRHRPDTVIYDVPRSRPVSVSSSIFTGQPHTPHYENSEIFINKDDRMNITEFTTF